MNDCKLNCLVCVHIVEGAPVVRIEHYDGSDGTGFEHGALCKSCDLDPPDTPDAYRMCCYDCFSKREKVQ